MNTLDKIKDKEKDFSELWDRIRADRAQILSEENPYTLVDSKGKAIPNTISVTPNDAEVHVNAIASILMDAKFQIAADGKITSKMQRNIEGFIQDSLAQIDESLEFNGESMLDFLANHICHTGLIGARYTAYMDGGKYKPKIVLLDMMECPFEFGEDSYTWVAPKFYRPASTVAEEYGLKESSFGKEVEIYDYWDSEINETYLDGKLSPKGTVKNKLGYPPFVIQFAPAGFMFKTKGYLKHLGESLLFLNRMLYKEVARIISIEQTLNMKRILPPLQKEVEDLSGPAAEYPDGIGKAVEVLTGEAWKEIPQSDLGNASMMVQRDIYDRVQRGGVNNIDLGNVSQTVSAIWITEQTEIRNKLLNPRIKALQRFYKQLSYMIIDQYIKRGISSEVGLQGRKTIYTVGELGDPEKYHIECRLMTRNKKQEIANIAEAQALQGIFSKKTILDDIMQHEDVEGEMARMDSEEAERISPVLKFRRMSLALAREAEMLEGEEAEEKFEEAKLMALEGIKLMNSQNQPMPRPENNQQMPNNSMVPVLGRGVTGGLV